MKNMKRAERRTWLETRKKVHLNKCLNYLNDRCCSANINLRTTTFNYPVILLNKDNIVPEYSSIKYISYYKLATYYTQVHFTSFQKRKYLRYFFNRHKASPYIWTAIGFYKSHSDWKIWGLQKKHINKALSMLEDYNNWCDDNNQIPKTNIHKYCSFSSDSIYD